MSRKLARRSSLLESLETRRHLDGNVTATIQAGSLLITGDGGDNDVVVTQSSDGSVKIMGRNDTTVNGQPANTLAGLSNDVIVNMTQEGTDRVAIMGGANLPRHLTATMGAGEFLVEGSFAPVKIAGNLSIQTAEEGTANVRNEVQVGGTLTIDSGADANVVTGNATLPDFASARFDHPLEINNPYFPVVPGAIYTYDAKGIDEETNEPYTERIVVRMLSETRTINGVQVRIVNDTVYKNGLVKEDTFDWYAQDNNGNVWYLGEDVTNNEYDDQGNLVETNHGGSWTAGVDGNQAGTIMEANPRVGHRYYQEFASANVVLDTGVGVGINSKVNVPAGKYKNAFRSEETTVTEPFALANKFYAPGVGIVKELDYDVEDNEIKQTTKLVSLTLNGTPVKTVLALNGFSGTNASGRLIGGATITGTTEIDATEPVVLTGADFAQSVIIGTDAEAILQSSTVAGNLNITATHGVALRDTFAEGTTRISTDGDLYILQSHVNRLVARFGTDDNSLSIRDSVLGKVSASGGEGENVFDDQGGNDIDALKLRGF